MSQHSFHDCPLRSSSLIIIHSEKQSIVTATDDVFSLLGYDPHQIIGKSIHLLSPRQHKNGILFRHENQGDRLFEVCVHHDPLQTSINLEYWLLKPKDAVADTPMTILRLCPFGTIEHAYPSLEFPQSSLELKGHPIMSFIHQYDVRLLCEKLKQCKVYDTFHIRWLKQHPRDGNEEDFIWLSFTVIHTPSHFRRFSCSTMHDPQTRPICIIRPVTNDETTSTTASMLTALWTFTKDSIMQHTVFGMEWFSTIIDELNKAIEQGKVYMIEYFAHIVTHALKLLCDIIEANNSTDPSKRKPLLITSVKVAIDNYVWSVPLLDNIIKRSSSQDNLVSNISNRKL